MSPSERSRRAAGAAAPGVSIALAALATVAALALAACAHLPRGSPRGPLEADSLTVGLWHMDEATGPDVMDSGPVHLHGTAGIDTRPQFGRFKQSRHFAASVNSFVTIPSNPLLDGEQGLTVEAWVYPEAFGDYLDTPIAARWSPEANAQSWLLTVVGRHVANPPAVASGDHAALVGAAAAGRLAFAYQPRSAGAPLMFFSSRTLATGRWSHVAATYDNQVVRLWINGVLDAQYVSRGRIAPSDAPLLLGNDLDPRLLTHFGGDLRIEASADPAPYYAFLGAIDEVRISSVARRSFPYGNEP